MRFRQQSIQSCVKAIERASFNRMQSFSLITSISLRALKAKYPVRLIERRDTSLVATNGDA